MSAQAVHSLDTLVRSVARRADDARVFDSVTVEPAGRPVLLTCAARGAASPAFYRLELDQDRLWVSLVMADRWLSESIEADLVHTGDSLEELIDEELVELGFDRGPLPCQHYRNDERLFIFRSPLPIDLARIGAPDADLAAAALLAYEACFRNLGDMSVADDD